MAGQIRRVSTRTSGGEANGFSLGPSFSPDGTKVVFMSGAANLVAGDTNGQFDVFIKDLATGAVQRVSTSAAGLEANGDSGGLFGDATFLPGGTKLIFSSIASNLVFGDTTASPDVFLKDLATGSIVRLYPGPGPTRLDVSPDGARIVFDSTAPLVAGDDNGQSDVFVQTLATGAIVRVSTGPGGAQASGSAPVFSPDGGRIGFTSSASNLVVGDTNGVADVFIKDLGTGAVTRVSTNAIGSQANGASGGIVFSPDGTKVAFESTATNFVAGGGGAATDIFVKDLATGGLTYVSATSTGGELTGREPVFSPDGTKILFRDTEFSLLYVKDLRTGELTLLSATSLQGGYSFSADGASVLYPSFDQLPGDTNLASDVFILAVGGQEIGGPAPDTLNGGAGDDLLLGEGGDDELRPGAGRNTVEGGAGSDTLSFFPRTENFYVDLRSGAGYVNGVQTELVLGVENLTGGRGNDVLAGDDGPNRIDGEAGSNVLYGFGGPDTFVSAPAPGLVQSQVFGGDGSDTIDYSAFTFASGVYIDLSAGAGYAAGTLRDLLNGVENAIGGTGPDTLVGTDADANRLVGGSGMDTLFGKGGDDILVGGAASSGQYNQLFGGAGQDSASYAGSLLPVYATVEGLGGFVDGGGGFVLVDSYSSIENLVGGAAADLLIGGSGPNRMTGGGSFDQIYGRAGPDTFVYLALSDSSPAARADTIADFQTGIDKLDLSALGFSPAQVVIASDTRSTVVSVDVDPSVFGYEFGIAFVGANAIVQADIVF